MSIYIILCLLFTHWIGDFVTQSHWMSINKSKDWNALISHIAVYTGAWMITVGLLGSVLHLELRIVWFIPITMLIHGAVDYYTSRVHSQMYKEEKYHEFFTSIGFDQLVHHVQIFLTFYLLTK